MKRLIGIMLSIVILFAVAFPMNAYADTGGSGNVDGGGGGMGDGTSTNSWTPGNEGVRVTVVRASDHCLFAKTQLSHFHNRRNDRECLARAYNVMQKRTAIARDNAVYRVLLVWFKLYCRVHFGEFEIAPVVARKPRSVE